MSGDDDLLERATRALRDTPPPSEEELRVERAVLLRAHRQNTNKASSRGRTLRWVLPLAAVLTAGSALAATGQIEVAVQAIARMLSVEKEPSEASEPKKKRIRAREEVVRKQREPVLPPALPAPTPPAVEPEPEPAEAPERVVPPAPPPPRRSAPRPVRESKETAVAEKASDASGVADAATSEASEPIPNGDLMRYRDAHELHFRARDFWSALRAWESYLRTYPEGTFAVEARYNRAICLVRLGRKDEARRALAPFAAGEVAKGYRKNEAAELLKALE